MLPKLPNELLFIISEYAQEMELLDWIDEKKLDQLSLCINPNASRYWNISSFTKKCWRCINGNPSLEAVNLLKKNKDKICWETLTWNTGAICLLEKNLDKIQWENIGGNENAIQIIEKNIDKIYYELGYDMLWSTLETNKNATNLIEKLYKEDEELNFQHIWSNENSIELIEKNIVVCDWFMLSANANAIHLIENELKRNPNSMNINWYNLNKNRNALHILKANKNRIIWEPFCENENKNTIEMIRNNLDKLTVNAWLRLQKNSNAIQLIKEHQDKINYMYLSKNPGIFECNINKIYLELRKILY